jgi:hypothetical protein
MIGVDGLVKNLRTNLEKGLTPNDLEDRVRHFGTNRKDPPERTPYWEFFIKAIDDFMLKLLLVCACVDIGFGVGFAEPEDRSHGKCFLLFLHSERALILVYSFKITICINESSAAYLPNLNRV